MKQIIIYIIFFCLLFPNSKSRIITNYDAPSKYSFITNYSSGSPMQYDTEYDFDIGGGLSVAYEHRVFKRDKFKGYLGAEIMLGKDSNTTLAFHSFYMMPTYAINPKINLLTRLGYTNINTSLKMPNNGYMFAIGTEVNLSDSWAIIFSNTWHESSKEYMNYQDVCVFFDDTCNDGDPSSAYTRISYSRFSISLAYGISKKEEPKSSSRSKGRKR